MTSYTIRNASSPEEVRRAVTQCAADEQWEIGMDDHELLFATDQSGIFIGELNGERISCLCVLKLGDNHAFLGHYIVDKPHRGKGYGLTIFKAGMASLSPIHNCMLAAKPAMVSTYEKWGFEVAVTAHTIKFGVTKTSHLLRDVNLPIGVSIRPSSEIDFDRLHSYTLSIHGAPFEAYLKKLLEAPYTLSFVAVSSDELSGFIAVRKLRGQDGWKISPLYANDQLLAKTLLKQIFSTLKTVAPNALVSLDIPHDCEAFILGQELGGRYDHETVWMYTHGEPNIPKHKVFGVLSMD